MKFKMPLFILLFIVTGNLSSIAATDDFSKISKVTQTFKAENFSGAAATSIPITVPPGRKGIQPNIIAQYASTSGNGWLGVGWTVDFGYIERSTKNRIPQYDSTDKFYISFMGISSELETASEYPDVYYPEVTSFFIKLLFKGSWWEAYDKEGKKYFFGSTLDSRIETGKGTFRWALNKVVDTCGNYMSITYTKDNNQIYPTKIEYTGNEVTSELPTHRVEFILEDRQDLISSFRSGYNIITAKRLKEIKTYVVSNLVNRYLFEYSYSRQTGRSLLNKFTCFGSDGVTSLPAMTFTYQDANPSNYNIVYTEPGIGNRLWYIKKSFGWSGNTTGALYPKRSGFKDFEGGGNLYWETMPSLNKSGDYWSIDEKGRLTVNLPEKTAFYAWTYVYLETAKAISIPFTGAGNFFFWLNADYAAPVNPAQINLKAGSNLIEITGYNATGPCSFDLNYALSDNVTRIHSNQFVIPQLSGDFNGDGLMDLATYYASSGRIKVSLSNGNGFQPAEYWSILPYDGFPKYLEPTPPFNFLLGNFNGDTLTDIRAINGATQVELITPQTDKCFYDEGGGGRLFPVKGNPFAADFNGDGTTDIGLQAENSNDILISLLVYQGNYYNLSPTYWLYNFAGKLLIGDFNGDGFTDIASYDSSQFKISVALNKGNAFDTPRVWLNGFNLGSTFTTTDCNGDGLTDICYYDKSAGRLFVAASDGNKFLSPVEFLSRFALKDPDVILQSGDFNGDNASDFYIFNPYTQKTEIAYSSFDFTDLLTKAENGTGGELTVKYDSSSNYDNTITEELISEYEYRNLSGLGLPFPVAVVKEITTLDGMGNSYSSRYSYKNGFYDRNDREFRGFGYISIVDSQGNQKELYFKQDDILKGKPYREEYKDPSGNLYLRIENNWGYQRMNADLFPLSGNFVVLYGQNKFTYDGDATFKKSYISYDYSFDIGEVPEFTTGDLISVQEGEDSAYRKTTEIKYVRQTSSDSILSRPSTRYTLIYNYNGNTGISHNVKQFFYDNNTDVNAAPARGLLTKEKVWLKPNLYLPNFNDSNVAITAYSYDTYGNLTTTTDAENHTTTTIFDSTYHIYPVRVTNALGHITSSTYDPKTGQVLTSIDANNQITTYFYDVFGRLTKVIGPNDTVQYPGIIYEYDLSSRPIKVTKRYKTAYPSTYAVEYSFYDGLGRLIETKVQAEDDPGSGQPRQIVKGVVTFNHEGKVKEKYNPYFVPASSSYSAPDASAPKTTFEYDCLGRTIKVINPDFTYRTIQYSDWTLTKTDENGHQIRSTYDAYDRLIKQEEFNNGETYITQYNYDVITYVGYYERALRIIDNQNNVTETLYDGVDRKERMSDPDMGTWIYTYDKVGNLKTQKDAKGQLITFDYDAINRIIKKSYPDGKYITYYYDDPGKSYCIGRLSYVMDLSGRTDFYYDKLGRQVKVINTIGTNYFTTEYSYNAAGQVISTKYPDAELVSYVYNNANAIDRITGTSSYINNVDYEAGGQIAKIDYANGTTTQYTYDPQTARLTDLKTNNGALQDLRYRYDSVGNIAGINDYHNTASQDFAYDGLNRIIQAYGSYGSFSYQYDALGNMINKEGVGFSYGVSGAKPHAVTSGTDGFSASYDANGNMTARNGATLTYDYDNRLVKFETSPTGQQITVQTSLSVGWNFVSLPLLVDNNSISVILASISGNYDQVSRYNPTGAKFEHYVPGQPALSQFSTMETGKGYQIYATSPCVLSITGRAPTTNYNVSLLTGWQLIGHLSRSTMKVSDALSGLVSGVNYSRICKFNQAAGTFTDLAATDYLEPGQAYFIRLLKNSTWTIAPGHDIIEFAYDASGSRVKKISNGTTTFYVGSLYEVTGSLITKHIYLGESRVVSKTGTQVYYYHSDHLGSTNVVTNASGAQAQLNEYKPFGELSKNTANLTNYYFTGKELDSTGLYFYGARYYDPRVGRFITPDTVEFNKNNPQTLNRYAYCLNNPLRYIDPTGEYSWDQTLDWTTGTFNNIFPSWQDWAGSSIYSSINSYFTSLEATLTSNPQNWIWNGSVSTVSQITQTLCFDWLNFGKDFPSISQNIQQGNYLNAGLDILSETGRGLFIAGAAGKLLQLDKIPTTFYHYGFAEDEALFNNGMGWGSYGTTTLYSSSSQAQLELALRGPLREAIYQVKPEWWRPVLGPFTVKSLPGIANSGGGIEFNFIFGTGKDTVELWKLLAGE